MNAIVKPAFFSLFGLLGLLLFACSDEQPRSTPSPLSPAPTPDLAATVESRVQAALAVRRPTPTPVPLQGRQDALSFSSSYRQLAADRERFYNDFDQWRQGLAACDASTFQASLRTFAGRTDDVSTQVGALRRPGSLGEVTELLFQAVAKEQRAYAVLRDTWTVNDTKGFEGVAAARAEAATLRKQAEDKLASLDKQTSTAARASVTAFAEALAAIDRQWDALHKDYDSFRSEEPGLDARQSVSRLSQLITLASEVTVAIRALPKSDLLRPLAETLASAAEREDLALRRARNLVGIGGASAPTATPASGGSGTPTPVARTSPFDEVDTALVVVNSDRQKTAFALADLQQSTSTEQQRAVTEYLGLYSTLAKNWDALHSDYDSWRRQEGGCSRTEAAKALGQSVLALGGLASRARSLPRSGVVRPLGELLTEALEREDRALRDLRDTWRPFDASVYQAFDGERAAANRLLRQVAAGLNDLLAQYEGGQ